MGTGTGVLPRNMYRYGAKWTGTDISENQIEQAKALSEGMDIDYYALSAENLYRSVIMRNLTWSIMKNFRYGCILPVKADLKEFYQLHKK